ncbi:MAG: hypothetical protein IPI90_14435 [Saprospiraceae bacterium]|nr:hypothetical protein [Candidatus Vicinibacter affinis]
MSEREFDLGRVSGGRSSLWNNCCRNGLDLPGNPLCYGGRNEYSHRPTMSFTALHLLPPNDAPCAVNGNLPSKRVAPGNVR